MSEQKLNGNWKVGWALDLYITDSVWLGDREYDNTYTEIGGALFQLKYRQDNSKIDFLADFVIEFMKTKMASVTPNLDVLLPVPSSNKRNIQPVEAVAEKISKSLNIVLDNTYLTKTRDTAQLKSIDDQAERDKLIEGVFGVRDSTYKNRNILLFDDLYRSGTTLREITKTLYDVGKVQNVYVVTLTKTKFKK